MKIISPKMIGALKEDTDLHEALALNDEEVNEYSFKGQQVTGLTNNCLNVQTCLFTNCCFLECNLKKSQFSDVVFRNCDLSNVNLSGCSFFRVEFDGCKLTGTNLSEANFNQVSFNQCRGEYVNISMSKLRYVQFLHCDMRGGGFDSSQFTDVCFATCNLMEAEFFRTPLKGIDLTDSEIAGIRVSSIAGNELRGATVSSLQALELARMLGITIKE